MVKKKGIGGHLKAIRKTQMSDSPDTNGQDQIPEDDSPADSEAPESRTTNQSQWGFPDRVYLLASIIFQNSHLEKDAAHRLLDYGKERGLSLPEVKDELMQRAAYELAFNTLKYQEMLEEIMIDSCFHLTKPVPDDQMRLVAVMLYDFQDRRFLPRHLLGEEIIQDVRDVEKYLLRLKTKLAASLARCRVKHDLLSIKDILPERIRKKQERSSSLPLFAWVNKLKSSLDEVQGVLSSAGFLQVESIRQLEGQTFCRDPHCEDTLVFPAHMKAPLLSTKLFSEHKLIIQDKSCSLGPNALCSLLQQQGDILMVGCFSGLTVAHVASLMADKRKDDNNENKQPVLYVCVTDSTEAQREELQFTVTTMGYKNVKLIPEVFQSLDGSDKRLQEVCGILLTPKCSMSALCNPVEFILQENRDTDLLQDLSRDTIAQSKLEALVTQQRKDIDHALKFPKVLAVVYSTCSLYPEENVKVVSAALQQACSDQKGDAKQAHFRLSPFPPSFSHHAAAPEEPNPTFTLEPSNDNNGCFLAVLTREPVVKEAPEEVIARANAKGILDRIGSDGRTKREQHGHPNRIKKAAHARGSLPNLSASIQSKSQQSRGSNSSVEFRHQKGELPQVKSKERSLPDFKSTFSYAKQKSPRCSSNSISSTPPLHTATASTSTPPTHPLLSTHVVPVLRPRKPQQEVLRPMVIVMPPVHFPNFFPDQAGERGTCPKLKYTQWKIPAHIVSHSHAAGGLHRDAAGKSCPPF